MDTTHIHPMIVHFPIALLITGFFLDTLGLFIKRSFFSLAGFSLLILGGLGVTVALLTGNMAGSGITEEGALKQALEVHEGAAILTVWLVGVTLVFRILLVLFNKYSGFLRLAAFTLFFISVLSVARTGYYGGELVYKHAAGVQINLGFDLNADPENN